MEELKSTEILEREIIEDARKKALRTLKLSEDTISVQNAKWEQKLAENIKKLEKKYIEEIKTEGEKVMSRLPVDKKRAKIESIENMLNSAVENWYKSLTRTQILDLLGRELTKSKEQLTKNREQRTERKEQKEESSDICARISGLEIAEAEAILKQSNLMCAVSEIPSLSRYPSIVIDTEDVRITASIENMIEALLDDKRSELVTALVGRDFLGDE